MTIHDEILAIGKDALTAARQLPTTSSTIKTRILDGIAKEIEVQSETVLEANKCDIDEALRKRLPNPIIERLSLNKSKLEEMAWAVREISKHPDPIGAILSETIRPNGLIIKKICVPIGVIAIIYESRPNVTVDATVLCLKSSNAVILKGGSDALNSNIALVKVLNDGGLKHGLPLNSVQLITSTDHLAVKELVSLGNIIDLVIPRGGESLVQTITELSRVPVIKHYKGVCHIYVHSDADLEMAKNIVINAKCQRPGVCNSMETLLVNKKIADKFIPEICRELSSRNVEIRGDRKTQSLFANSSSATEDDWFSEYLDLCLSVRVISSLEEAITHINHYGSHHSDSIVTTNPEVRDRFMMEVDSAAVYWNASTRFTDGGEFGLGAEIGISTDKIHARGPMGVNELTSYKYVIYGNGQIRQ